MKVSKGAPFEVIGGEMIYEIGCFKCGEMTMQVVLESTTEVTCGHCGHTSSAFSLITDQISGKDQEIQKLKEEIDHCKKYYSKENKIGPIAQLEYAIEKRDKLLSEVINHIGNAKAGYPTTGYEQWLKEYGELIK